MNRDDRVARCGDIGDDQREIELEPIEVPIPIPEPQKVPA